MIETILDENKLSTHSVPKHDNFDTKTTTYSWSNQDNINFYEKITPEIMQQFSVTSGLEGGCDIQNLLPYWKNATSILEIGAGYGRVINSLLKNGFTGKITALERSSALFQYLKNSYSDNPNINLLHLDLYHYFNFKNSFDVILFLWSGIADFYPVEQQKIFFELAKLLNNKGKLILDTLSEDLIPIGMENNENNRMYKLTFNDTSVHTYSMSIEEINFYANLAGFKKVKHIPYFTETDRKRVLHVLYC